MFPFHASRPCVSSDPAPGRASAAQAHIESLPCSSGCVRRSGPLWLPSAGLLVGMLWSGGVAAVTTVMVDLRPDLSGTNFNQPFLRGSNGVVDVYMENCPGLACNNTATTSVYLRLPPGLSYVSHQGFRPTFVTCSAGAVTPAGQTIACTGAGLSGNPLSINKTSGVVFTVAVASDAPLGPAPIYVGLDEQAPAGSTTLAQCLLDTAPIWCDVMDLGIATPPVPELVFEGGSFSGGGLAVGDETGTVTANFRNIGTAAAARTNIQVQLPRGTFWRSGGNGSAPGAFNCTSSGSVDPGFILTCTSTTTLNPNASGFLRIGLNPGVTASNPLELLYSIDSLPAPAPNGLAECRADPTRLRCLQLIVPLRTGCEGRPGNDWIYCNGYEAPGVPPP